MSRLVAEEAVARGLLVGASFTSESLTFLDSVAEPWQPLTLPDGVHCCEMLGFVLLNLENLFILLSSNAGDERSAISNSVLFLDRFLVSGQRN